MEESSLLSKMLLNLRATCTARDATNALMPCCITWKAYTGYPKDLGRSRVVHFTSEREFVQLLHQGHPVVVAFTITCNLTKRLDRVLEEAAAEFHPHVKFMRVECPKYPGFCITRQKAEYPFIEIFHSPEQAANQVKAVDPNITKYYVRVLPFTCLLITPKVYEILTSFDARINYDVSAYEFREYFKRNGIKFSD